MPTTMPRNLPPVAEQHLQGNGGDRLPDQVCRVRSGPFNIMDSRSNAAGAFRLPTRTALPEIFVP